MCFRHSQLKPLRFKAFAYKVKGFTLIEVLIAILILSIGLLGSANMQAIALNYSQRAHDRIQALKIAEDIVSRMKANRSYINALRFKYPQIPEDYQGFNIYSDENNWSYNQQSTSNNISTNNVITNSECKQFIATDEVESFTDAFNCRARFDLFEIREKLKPNLINPVKSLLVFVDCQDSDQTSEQPDNDPCSPGSFYSIFIFWPDSALINERCIKRLSYYLNSNPSETSQTSYNCLLMDFIP